MHATSLFLVFLTITCQKSVRNPCIPMRMTVALTHLYRMWARFIFSYTLCHDFNSTTTQYAPQSFSARRFQISYGRASIHAGGIVPTERNGPPRYPFQRCYSLRMMQPNALCNPKGAHCASSAMPSLRVKGLKSHWGSSARLTTCWLPFLCVSAACRLDAYVHQIPESGGTELIFLF